MKNGSKKIAALVALVVVIVCMAAIYMNLRPQPEAGSKTITIQVVSADETAKDYTVSTDAEYLRQAMEETEGLTFSGDESEYGMMVTEVNGEVADYNADGAYWAFYINDEYCEYGIDTQTVTDGDTFSIVYTIYSE